MLYEMKLKGHVKLITALYYIVPDSTILKGDTFLVLSHALVDKFDEDGNIYEQISAYKIRPDYFDTVTREYFYRNKEAHLVKSISLMFDSSKKVDSTIATFETDANGNIIKVTNHYTKNLNSTCQYKYDKKGNRTEMSNGFYRTTYMNDDAGNEISSYSVDSNNVFEDSSNSKYDKHKNRIEHVVYGNPFESRKTTYKYDSLGNMTEIIEYNDNGAMTKKTTIRYNDYDTHGNYKVAHEFRNDTLIMVTRRKFEYYE